MGVESSFLNPYDARLKQEAIKARCFHPTGTFIAFAPEDVEQTLPASFEKMVRKYPHRLAVRYAGCECTYDELNRYANRIAHAILRRRGEGSEPILLLFEQGLAVIATILGVLKAGKIYVPQDSAYPIERAVSALEDSQAALILTNRANLSEAHRLARGSADVINVDDLDASVPDANPTPSLSPDDLMSIIYTSGSTGQPKGVMRSHRSMLHSVMEYTNCIHICPEDRITLVSSYSFSASMRHIFGALHNGASLFPFDLKHEGVPNLAKWLIEEEITIYHVNPPTVFRQLARVLAEEERRPKVRLIRMAGDSIYKQEVDTFKKYFADHCVLYIVLSSGETGTMTQYFIDKDTEINRSNVSLGYASPGMELQLLDDAGRQVGLHQIGEIVVKSRFLASGYWRRPDLTDEKFLPDPDGGDERLYRTGDLGIMRPDGCIEHRGRKDFRIKVRGQNVDAAEVERALCNLDDVEEAVVMPREDQVGHQHLVAYLVTSPGTEPTVTALQRALTAQLAEYKVPSTFVFLDTLPRTANGKVDRRALPKPDGKRPALETPFMVPRTPVEVALADIWADVLGLEKIGIHDNFLELGGHSLLATLVISRVIKAFGVELSVPSLFQSHTVAEMAIVIAQNQAQQAHEADVERILEELEALSDQEAKERLAQGTDFRKGPIK